MGDTAVYTLRTRNLGRYLLNTSSHGGSLRVSASTLLLSTGALNPTIHRKRLLAMRQTDRVLQD